MKTIRPASVFMPVELPPPTHVAVAKKEEGKNHLLFHIRPFEAITNHFVQLRQEIRNSDNLDFFSVEFTGLTSKNTDSRIKELIDLKDDIKSKFKINPKRCYLQSRFNNLKNTLLAKLELLSSLKTKRNEQVELANIVEDDSSSSEEFNTALKNLAWLDRLKMMEKGELDVLRKRAYGYNHWQDNSADNLATLKIILKQAELKYLYKNSKEIQNRVYFFNESTKELTSVTEKFYTPLLNNLEEYIEQVQKITI